MCVCVCVSAYTYVLLGGGQSLHPAVLMTLLLLLALLRVLRTMYWIQVSCAQNVWPIIFPAPIFKVFKWLSGAQGCLSGKHLPYSTNQMLDPDGPAKYFSSAIKGVMAGAQQPNFWAHHNWRKCHQESITANVSPQSPIVATIKKGGEINLKNRKK